MLYLVLFLLGLVLPTAFGLVPLFGVPDLLLHLGTAVIALGAYYFASSQGTAEKAI